MAHKIGLIGFIIKVGLYQIKDTINPEKNPKHIGHLIQYPRKSGFFL
jgi:hypothetical protein